MLRLRTVADCRAFRHAHPGRTLALVPTMGYLHEGHLSLMRAAADHADLVMASLFVNPTQFAPGEDLDTYPRDEAGDLAKAEAAGCAALFAPDVAAMYHPDASTTVRVGGLTDGLCGASRPTHFDGVCTVVAKLFGATGCDVAVFGEKDYQQLAVIRRFVRDLDFPVRVVGGPIVREPDGVAMSSRNVRLSEPERVSARSLHRSLQAARARWAEGERGGPALEALVRDGMDPAGEVDYVEVRDAEDLSRVTGDAARPVVVAVAVRFGATRLIDNVVLGSAPDQRA